jgi:hypothetical protein
MDYFLERFKEFCSKVYARKGPEVDFLTNCKYKIIISKTKGDHDKIKNICRVLLQSVKVLFVAKNQGPPVSRQSLVLQK